MTGSDGTVRGLFTQLNIEIGVGVREDGGQSVAPCPYQALLDLIPDDIRDERLAALHCRHQAGGHIAVRRFEHEVGADPQAAQMSPGAIDRIEQPGELRAGDNERGNCRMLVDAQPGEPTLGGLQFTARRGLDLGEMFYVAIGGVDLRLDGGRLLLGTRRVLDEPGDEVALVDLSGVLQLLNGTRPLFPRCPQGFERAVFGAVNCSIRTSSAVSRASNSRSRSRSIEPGTILA